MNLNANPSTNELKDLIATADDSAGHHILWVDVAGDVHLNCLFPELTPAGFEEEMTRVLKLRYETFSQGAGYVGPEGAEDESFLARLLKSMVKEWARRPSGSKSEYIDDF